MNRDEILDRAAKAMFETHDPGHARQRPYGSWAKMMALLMYRSRFITGLNAVEADLAAEYARIERERIVTWLEAQVFDGLDSPNPESAVQILIDRIREGETS